MILAIGLVAGLTLFLIAIFPALALQLIYRYTTVQDFNKGIFYHTALSWQGDGEVRLLPIGLGQPWQPGNNTGFPPRAALAGAYAEDYIYAIAGEPSSGIMTNTVFYSRVHSDVLTASGRLSDWQETTPIPASIYPYGVFHHDAVALAFAQPYHTYIYVFGGRQEENVGDPLRVYDKALFAEVQPDGTLGSWTETTPLPKALYAMESVVLNGRIYIVGGADKDGISNNLVYYTEPDPNSGWISGWSQTSASLPPLGGDDGGYFEAAVTVNQGRIYVYGGASGTNGPSYSVFVQFGEPLTSGDIVQWHLNAQRLPVNCYASEGADYESGLLLAIAGAWSCGMGCTPSGDVQVALVDGPTGETSPWYSTIAMDPPRFFHAVVEDPYGWLYSLGGNTGSIGPRMNNVDIAPPYGGGGLLRQGFSGTEQVSPTVYAPEGTYTSKYLDVRPIQEDWYHATLTSFKWNTTITDPQAMTVTMSYTYYSPTVGWLPWSDPIASRPGIGVTTTVEFPPGTIGDSFQYRAFLSATTLVTTNVATQTPLLNDVQVGVLSPPDLKPMSLTVICDSCPEVIPLDTPVQIELKAVNNGSSLPLNNNFFIMIFLTTTEGYMPIPPDVPPGCAGYDPPTVTCPLVLPQQAVNFPEGASPLTVRTTYTFTQAGVYWLVAYVDYNNTPRFSPPIYDVGELIELNNIERRLIWVGVKLIYLPLLTRSTP